jgi:gluconate kinase
MANGGRDLRLMDGSHMLGEIIDHLHAFIESTALPAIEELSKLRESCDLEIRRLHRKLDNCHRQNNNLHRRIDVLLQENMDAKEKIEALTLAQTSFQLKMNILSSTDENNAEWLDSRLAATLSRLAECQNEIKAQKSIQKKFEKQLRNYYQKVNELTYEKDYAVAQKRMLEKKYLEMEQQLLANEVVLLNSGEASVNDFGDYFAIDDNNTSDNISTVELSYSQNFADRDLPEGFFNRTTEGDVKIYNLNEELEVDDYENPDDLWPDEAVSISSESSEESTSTVLEIDTEMEGESQVTELSHEQ